MMRLPIPFVMPAVGLPAPLTGSSTAVANTAPARQPMPVAATDPDFAAAFTAAARSQEEPPPVEAFSQDVSAATLSPAARFASNLEDCGAREAESPECPPSLLKHAWVDTAADEAESVPVTSDFAVPILPDNSVQREPVFLPVLPVSDKTELRVVEVPPNRPTPMPQAAIPIIAPTDLQLLLPQISDVPATRSVSNGIMIDLARSDWITTFSRHVEAASGRSQEVSMRLAPAHLGVIEIAVTDTAKGLVIDLRPGSDDAAQIFAREEPRLLEELRQRGVSVAEYTLRNGVSDDGRRHHNGANAQAFLPYQHADRFAIEDQDRDGARAETGRFA